MGKGASKNIIVKDVLVPTWIFMGFSFFAAVILPFVISLMIDKFGEFSFYPLLVIIIPLLLGLIGGFFAFKKREYWWALISTLWGFVIVQIVFLLALLITN